MEIDEEGLPIHRDATLKIRPRIFLEGNFFVDLRPGSPSAPEVSGRRHDRSDADVDAGPARPAAHGAAVRPARRPADAAAGVRQCARHEADAGAGGDARPRRARQDRRAGAQRQLHVRARRAQRAAALVNSALLGTEPHDLSRMIAAIARPDDHAAHERARAAGPDRQLQHDRRRVRVAERRAAAGRRPARPDAHDRRTPPSRASTPRSRRRAASRATSRPAVLRDAGDGQGGVPVDRADARAAAAGRAGRPARRSCSRRRRTSRGSRARRCNSCRSSTTRTAASRERSSRPATSAWTTARSTTRRGDGSIVENYKEFWYGMVGLAGEGADFDGNGSTIRTGARRRRRRPSTSGKSRADQLDGHRQREPQAARFEPDLSVEGAAVRARRALLPTAAAGRQRPAVRSEPGAARASSRRRRRRCRTRWSRPRRPTPAAPATTSTPVPTSEDTP